MLKRGNLGLAFCLMMPIISTAQENLVCRADVPICAPLPASRVLFSKAYPICFFDVDLGAVDAARAFWPEYSQRIFAALEPMLEATNNAQILSSRTIVVRTTLFRHRQIEKMWPEIACIGASGGETSVRRRKICVEAIKSAITESKSSPEKLGELICQTFIEAPLSSSKFGSGRLIR
jgi:hypothetical protein